LKRWSNDETTYNQYVVYDYLITNMGNVDLTNLQLSDNLLQQIADAPTSLSAGESKTIRKEYRVKLEDKKDLTNQATVTAKFGATTVRDVSETDTVKMQLTELSVFADRNTGGVRLEVRLQNDPQVLIVQCHINADETQFCGTIHANVKYKFIAYPAKCRHQEFSNVVYVIPERTSTFRCP